MKDPVLAYARAVLKGKIRAGPHVRNACRRHLDDLKHGPERGLRWDRNAAAYSAGFFPDVLCLNSGQFEGLPFHLQPSQAFIVGSLFGWKRADGRRRFRRAYIEEGKGNGKSPLMAGIGLYCLVADGEARAEVYAAASKKDQAMVLFRDAVAMVDQSPALRSRIQKSGVTPVWNLGDHKTGSFFRPISSEDGQSGPRPSCALCDEVHEHYDGGDTISMLEKGFKWRRQPLLIMATNSGTDRNSICWEEHQHAIRAAAGTRDLDEETFTYVGDLEAAAKYDDTFAYVCALDKGDDPLEDRLCWIKANPLLGITVQIDDLAIAVNQAKVLPGKLNSLMRLNFCVWTDVEEAWISRETAESVMATFDPAIHLGKDLYIGADLSGSQDLTALGCVTPTGTIEVERTDPDTHAVVRITLPTYDAWVEVWTPAETLAERAQRDQAPYDVWVKQGWLKTVPGRIIRLDFIAARIAALNAEYRLRLLAYDRYAYRKLEQEMADMGLTVSQAEHPQGGVRRAKPTEDQLLESKRTGRPVPAGLWMPGSVIEIETLILEKRIRFLRNPVLISAMMSAAMEHDAFDNRWFSKRKAVNRIDPLVAGTMACGAAAMETPSGESVYEKRDLLVL